MLLVKLDSEWKQFYVYLYLLHMAQSAPFFFVVEENLSEWMCRSFE